MIDILLSPAKECEETVDILHLVPGVWTRPGPFPQRFWEIDYCRGIAVVMMVVFHAGFDLAYFGIWDADVHSGPWKLLAVCTASLFLLLVGLSLTLSGARAQKTLDRRSFLMKYLCRGAGIIGLGCIITGVTLVMVPGEPILFGILHLIGLSVMLAPLYLRFAWENLFAGLAVIAVGFGISGILGPIWLVWLGVHPAGFASLDYTPVFPWFGVVLIGVWIGHMLYPRGVRKCPLPINHLPGKEGVCLLGRHSLAIYLVHQPALLFVISQFYSPLGLPLG
ncbi:MAG: DUF1624 domain-containing protein [Methanolinea sp.]|nr:DUF1624 domain-containing protein [Methanolinea sp.]